MRLCRIPLQGPAALPAKLPAPCLARSACLSCRHPSHSLLRTRVGCWHQCLPTKSWAREGRFPLCPQPPAGAWHREGLDEYQETCVLRPQGPLSLSEPRGTEVPSTVPTGTSPSDCALSRGPHGHQPGGAGGALSSLRWGLREPLGNPLGSWCLFCPSPGPLRGGTFSSRLYSHVCLPNYTASLASAVA